jgi:hypothetical protein
MGFRAILPSKNYVHERQHPTRLVNGAYLLPALLVSTALTQNGIPSELAIIRGAVKLSAPDLSDVLQSLKKNSFDLLVQLCDPMIEICIALKVESIDLEKMYSAERRKMMTA